MAETMFKTAQEMLDQRRKDTQDNLLTIKAIEGKQRERPLSGYAKFGGMLGKAAGESLKDYLGVKSEDDYLRDYENGIEQRRVLEQSLGQEGSLYSPEIASQIDRFIEESGSNLSPEIKRASDFTRDMKGLTPEQLGNPMNVASIYNKHGYTEQAVNLLNQNRMTPYQRGSLDIAQQNADTAALTANQFNLGVGTGDTTSTATSGATPPPNELRDGTEVLVDGVPNVIVNGKPVPVAQVEALKNQGTTAEQGVLGNIADALASPFKYLADASQGVKNQSDITFVKNALERNSFRPEDRKAAKNVLQMPREETGFTEKQYEILDAISSGGLPLGGK
jgi:hypothetical protein